MYCEKCGRQYISTKKVKKLLLTLLLGCSMVIGLCGCGKDQNSAKKTQSAIEAYKEYYNEFYNEHYLDDIGYFQYLYQSMGLDSVSHLQYDEEYGSTYDSMSVADCAGKIVLVDNVPILVIADAIDLDTYADDEYEGCDVVFNVYFYEFIGKKVTEKVMIPDVKCYDDGFSVFSVNDEIYLYTDAYTTGEKIYRVNGNSYSEVVEGQAIVQNGNSIAVCVDNKMFDISGNLVYNIISESNAITNEDVACYALNGTVFTNWLEYLSEQEMSNELELDIIYGKYLLENELEDDFEIVCWQNGVYYYYYEKMYFDMVENLQNGTEDEESSDTEEVVEHNAETITDCTLVMYNYDDYCVDIVVPESVMGYEVKGIDMVEDSDKGIGMYFDYYVYKDVNIYIHNNVTYIDSDMKVFGVGDMSYVFKCIFCEENSYAHQYALENGNPYILGTIVNNNNGFGITPNGNYIVEGTQVSDIEDKVQYPDSYIQGRAIYKYYGYVEEYYNGDAVRFAQYKFVDSNEDTKPILLCYEDDSISLCYLDENNNVQSMWLWGDIAIDSNGTIIDKGISMSFDYIPDTRLLVYNQETNTYETTHVLSLKNTDNWADFDWTDYDYSKIKEDTRLFTYYVDDVQYATYEEAINVFNSYYAYGTQIEIKNFYNSLEEAYENIGIDEIGFYIGDIEAMSYTDGVLSISDDYGVSISYSVADDCVWEFDSPFDETLTPITYEEIERDWTEARNYYLEYGEMYWSYYAVTVVVKDNQVIRVYTSHN